MIFEPTLLPFSHTLLAGPDIYVRTQEQLHATRKWLQSSPNPQQAASVYVRVAADTLLCVETSIQVCVEALDQAITECGL